MTDWMREHDQAMARFHATPRWRWRRRRIHKQAARSAMWLLLTDEHEAAARRRRLAAMSEPRVIERRECGRCGAEVAEHKRKHFCGRPHPLKAYEDLRFVRYVEDVTPTTGKEQRHG